LTLLKAPSPPWAPAQLLVTIPDQIQASATAGAVGEGVAWTAVARKRGSLALGQFVLNVRPVLLDAVQALLSAVPVPRRFGSRRRAAGMRDFFMV
jgi:hypothetical protein